MNDYDGDTTEWEVTKVVCPKGHQQNLSIMKSSPVRNTYCCGCGKAVHFKRLVEKETKDVSK